jgi:hypothetical protein
MEVGLSHENHFKTSLSLKTTVKSMLNIYLTSVFQILIAKQKSSLQVLESSSDQDHADGNDECRSIGAFEEAVYMLLAHHMV